MYLALVLHIYQPPTQYPEMVRRITEQSYTKIVDLLERFPKAKITLNIPGSLSGQLLEMDYEALLGRIRRLSERGQVELTGTAAYHPILPHLPKTEIVRQIKINTSINTSFFGSSYQPRGFFPPELGYSKGVGEVLEELGFQWVFVGGTALADWQKFVAFVYVRKGGRLFAFPREDTLSWRIAFGRLRTLVGLRRAIGRGELAKQQYAVVAMDGETFGHHQPRQLELLEQLFSRSDTDGGVPLVSVSELVTLFSRRKEVDVALSTWGYTEWVDGERVWVRWRNPQNPLHTLLKKFQELSFRSVTENDAKSRQILDRALCSDTFWWASGRPYKHPGMVERGSRLFLDAILSSESATTFQKQEARELHHTISRMGYRVPGKRKRG